MPAQDALIPYIGAGREAQSTLFPPNLNKLMALEHWTPTRAPNSWVKMNLLKVIKIVNYKGIHPVQVSLN